MENKKRFNFVAIGLIVILGLGVYLNSIWGEFIWDDNFLIRDNAYVKDWSNIKEIFTTDWGAGAGKVYTYYRPLTLVVNLINYSLFGTDVRGYHLTTILFHILVAASIYWLVTLLYNDRRLSLLTSLFFVVHPVHNEVVAFISGRVDSMALVFMLFTFIFYIKYLRAERPVFLGIALLSYASALLTKEGSLILPALILLYHYVFREKIKLRAFMGILSAPFIYILLRLSPLISAQPKLLLSFNAFLQRIPGFFVALVNYIRLLVWPFDLHMEYGAKLFYYNDPKAILGFVIFISLLIYAFRIRNRNRFVFFSIAWFFVALVPVSNLGPIGMYMAEHYLYVPSVGFFLLLGKGVLSPLPRLRRTSRTASRPPRSLSKPLLFDLGGLEAVLAMTVTIILVFYSYLTVKQNNYWREPIAFYERTLEYTPDSPRVLKLLADEHTERGEYGRAISLYQRIININPNYAEPYHYLGSIYGRSGQNDKAIGMFKKAIKIRPQYALAHNNLASAYYFAGERELAVKHADIALALGYPVTPELLELLKGHRGN